MELLVKLLITYVRPILEFASQVWSPFDGSDVHSSVLVENVQRTFTRRLFYRAHFPKVSYEQRLAMLGISKLQTRHLVSDLTTVYQVMRNLVDLPLDELFQPSYRRLHLRAHHPFMIRVPKCRLKLCR